MCCSPGPAISVGGLGESVSSEQIQQYAPVKYYSNLSLLLEGLTGSIPDPDTSLGGATAADTVQRPFDAIGPNWSSSKNRARPLQVFLGMPFEFAGMRFVAGAGAVEYIDLNYSYQNNNVLSPSILSERPLPFPRPSNDANPTLVQWSQRASTREGAVRGYGAALSTSLPEYNLSFGISGMILNGSSDDFDRIVGRGRLTFYTNYFRLEPDYGTVTRTGISEFSGREITLSAMYRSRAVLFGVNVRPPNTISRKYSGEVRAQGTTTSGTTIETVRDRIILPWRGTAGISITPKAGFLLAIEYELRPYASADYKGVSGGSHPWLSASLLRFGAAYDLLPWLVIRAGMRGQAEVFEPEGNPIPGEPVTYSIYSLGAGLSNFGFRLDVAYEYSVMKYQDVWGSAVSLNRTECHNVVVNLTYDIPEFW